MAGWLSLWRAKCRAHGRPVAAPACMILGGETTVTLGDNPGKGGRNQELALAAALALDGMEGITVVALATDGSDGPTDSAGRRCQWNNGRSRHVHWVSIPDVALQRHDA